MQYRQIAGVYIIEMLTICYNDFDTSENTEKRYRKVSEDGKLLFHWDLKGNYSHCPIVCDIFIYDEKNKGKCHDCGVNH